MSNKVDTLNIDYTQAQQKYFKCINRYFIKNQMSKIFFSFLVIYTLAVLARSVSLQNQDLRIISDQPNLSDKEIIQQSFNGIFQQNRLSGPKNAVSCFDDNTAHQLVILTGHVLDKGCNANITDIISQIKQIKDFQDQIPAPVIQCLKADPQVQRLSLLYGIDGNTNLTQVQKKVLSYYTLHLLNVRKWFVIMNNNWQIGKYYQVGFDAAGYGHNVLPVTDVSQLDRKEQLQMQIEQALNKISNLPYKFIDKISQNLRRVFQPENP